MTKQTGCGKFFMKQCSKCGCGNVLTKCERSLCPECIKKEETE